MHRKLLILISLILPLATYADSAVLEFQNRIEKRVLSNGIRVIVSENAVSPVFAGYLKIGVGSANEPFDSAGAAHFLEHLLFKGNSELGTRDYTKEKVYLDQIFLEGERLDAINRRLADPLLTEIDRKRLSEKKEVIEKRLSLFQDRAAKYVISEQDSLIYSEAGEMGYNAYTSSDFTNYQIKLPANRLELWMVMESRRFQAPVFREFYKERKVIAEERRMRYDSQPSNLLYEHFLTTAFGMSPYGKPVIGFGSNIPNLTYNQVDSFFRENYVPSRMVISVIGDVNAEEVFELAEKHFGKIQGREPQGMPPIGFDKMPGEKRAALSVAGNPVLIKGWTRPPVSHPDAILFDILSEILADGQTSRLYKRLVTEEKLASSVSAHSGVPGEKLENQFALFVSAYREEDYPLIEKVIAEELSKIVLQGIDQSELTKIKNNYLAGTYSTMEKNAGIAEMLSYYEVITGDYNNFFRAIEKVKGVDSDQIITIVKQYFVKENETTVWLNNPDQRSK